MLISLCLAVLLLKPVNCRQLVCWSASTLNELQSDYRGIQSTTAAGDVCQKWSEWTPHVPSGPLKKMYANSATEYGLGEHNYCRYVKPM